MYTQKCEQACDLKRKDDRYTNIQNKMQIPFLPIVRVGSHKHRAITAATHRPPFVVQSNVKVGALQQLTPIINIVGNKMVKRSLLECRPNTILANGFCWSSISIHWLTDPVWNNWQ